MNDLEEHIAYDKRLDVIEETYKLWYQCDKCDNLARWTRITEGCGYVEKYCDKHIKKCKQSLTLSIIKKFILQD